MFERIDKLKQIPSSLDKLSRILVFTTPPRGLPNNSLSSATCQHKAFRSILGTQGSERDEKLE
jgi:hypothetical protein